MKLVSYATPTDSGYGVLTDDGIVALAGQNGLPNDTRSFLEQGDVALSTAREVANTSPAVLEISSVSIGAPISNPSKIIAIGLNYADHVEEIGASTPEFPVVFSKFPSSIVGPSDPIRWNTSVTRSVDWEAELAVVIGTRCKDVPAVEALSFVAGYMNCHDVSARDLQARKGDQWQRGKSLDSFCPIGPYLLTADEVPDPGNLDVTCTVNGEIVQSSNTDQLVFGVAEIIAFVSTSITLLPGDIIITGTPGGVGAFRNPPVFLADGDVVTVEVEGLGQLTNRCVVDA
jgi:2-keto-4-pentenoate hydratase/2-oxohepta-3-ene-1,7-dioic acid hydratase in catechol pathway